MTGAIDWSQVKTADAQLTDAQNEMWERIKAERDRRQVAGVKVGDHWYHSDHASRVQFVALVTMGAGLPAGTMWKTLTRQTHPPVYVEMTPTIAQGVFARTGVNDIAVFAAAEMHAAAMRQAADPRSYDFSTGWPTTIYDETEE